MTNESRIAGKLFADKMGAATEKMVKDNVIEKISFTEEELKPFSKQEREKLEFLAANSDALLKRFMQEFLLQNAKRKVKKRVVTDKGMEFLKKLDRREKKLLANVKTTSKKRL